MANLPMSYSPIVKSLPFGYGVIGTFSDSEGNIGLWAITAQSGVPLRSRAKVRHHVRSFLAGMATEYPELGRAVLSAAPLPWFHLLWTCDPDPVELEPGVLLWGWEPPTEETYATLQP